MKEQNTTSTYIKEFLNFLTVVRQEYSAATEEEKRQSDLTQDYLHSLELDGLKCGERSKIATKLVSNRQARRVAKDTKEELEPLIMFLQDQNNKKVIDKLSQTLGDIRKIERKHQHRFYIPRVLLKETEE